MLLQIMLYGIIVILIDLFFVIRRNEKELKQQLSDTESELAKVKASEFSYLLESKIIEKAVWSLVKVYIKKSFTKVNKELKNDTVELGDGRKIVVSLGREDGKLKVYTDVIDSNTGEIIS